MYNNEGDALGWFSEPLRGVTGYLETGEAAQDHEFYWSGGCSPKDTRNLQMLRHIDFSEHLHSQIRKGRKTRHAPSIPPFLIITR